MITFFLSGLWHGAAWTFIVWGVLHGLGLLVHQQWTRLRLRLGWQGESEVSFAAARLVTFAFLLVTWVYFRAPSLTVANQLIATMFGAHGLGRAISLPGGETTQWLSQLLGWLPTTTGLPIDLHALACVGFLFAIAWFAPNTQQLLARYQPALEAVTAVRWSPVLGLRCGAALGLIVFLVIRTQATSQPSPFLYFNF
jgi:hypothetical protein